jgi:hypothetical protein
MQIARSAASPICLLFWECKSVDQLRLTDLPQAPLFVGMWVGICVLLGLFGGWASLANQFRAGEPVQGERFRLASGSSGVRFFPVGYGNCLFVTLNETGFGLSILFLFRIFHPPLFIPWREVESAERRRFLFRRYTVIRIRGHWPIISIGGNAGEQLHQAFTRFRNSTPR